MLVLGDLDPVAHRRHSLHGEERAWIETNCYVDLWIEILHAFGHDPVASLAFTVAVDFEGDQWLFFKQPSEDLVQLYGVDLQELNIYGEFLAHAEEQLRRGRLVMVELDAFYMPDTAGVSYKTAHSKSTIGIAGLDVAARRLHYFHNAGFCSLEGADFDGLFGLDGPRSPGELPPYTEFVKFRARPNASELSSASLSLLRKHFARRPTLNPFHAFRERFLHDVVALRTEGPDAFHRYAFATLRQCGSAAELSASYLAWLKRGTEIDFDRAAAAFTTIASQAKTLQFKAARAVIANREVDFAPMLDAMESAWDVATTELAGRLRA